MQLRDYSDLKDLKAEAVEIPLNGVTYRAVPEPPAETVLAATGAGGGTVALMEALAASGVDERDPAAMQELAKSNPVLAMRIATAGLTQTERSMKFLSQVLEPDSAQRWLENMRAKPPCPPKEDPETWQPSPRLLADHRRRQITLRQAMAVYQELVQHYSQRPTEPPVSSRNGDGGTGETSTAGAPAEA